MEIRKGPYGQFVIKKIGDIGSIHTYTQRIVEENIPGHMLPLYVIPAVSTYELSYDCSGLIPLSVQPLSHNPEFNRLRKALGDLFLSLCRFPDYLLSPASVILDERFMFTDKDYSSISICYDPSIPAKGKLSISSLADAGLRAFLKSQNLRGILTSDETDRILYAVEQNDENLLILEAGRIMQPLPEEDKRSELIMLNEFKLTILLSLISLIFALLKFTIPSLLAVVIESAFAVRTFRTLKNKPEIVISDVRDSSKRIMLFGDSENNGNIVDALILTTSDPVNGQEEKRAVYTDKAAIGSDRFLCDICYPDKEMSAIHAQIKKTGSTYYVSDLSADNSTFLNDIRLTPGQDYEIKSEQVLMCGRREFRIQIM